MSLLSQIESFIQPCLQVISSVLDLHITVVDDNLVRLCGTGVYEASVGTTGYHDSFFESILQSGQVGFATNPKSDPNCANCSYKHQCPTKAVLGYPINYHNRLIGIIGISAFSDSEYVFLTENHEKLQEFCKYISMLIVSQLENLEYADQLKQQLSAVNQQNSPVNIVGTSSKILELLDLANRIATSDSTVLITGESGTGKDEMAKHLHFNSDRRDGPLISVNCGAIPENLVESELFGYEGGSFTGAKKSGSVGKFQLADHGTLFLDEVGELPLSAQAKLLRFLQERTIERVGGREAISIDVRVIAATNQNLEEMVAARTFRQDLYYRLNVIPMHMPPLRERDNDILLLANYFLTYYNQKLHKKIRGFDNQSEELLRIYSWPGNIRELRNIIEYLVNISPGPQITADDFPDYLTKHTEINEQHTLNELIQNYEKSILMSRLKSASTRESRLAVAKELGISQATLYRKIAQYDL